MFFTTIRPSMNQSISKRKKIIISISTITFVSMLLGIMWLVLPNNIFAFSIILLLLIWPIVDHFIKKYEEKKRVNHDHNKDGHLE